MPKGRRLRPEIKNTERSGWERLVISVLVSALVDAGYLEDSNARRRRWAQEALEWLAEWSIDPFGAAWCWMVATDYHHPTLDDRDTIVLPAVVVARKATAKKRRRDRA